MTTQPLIATTAQRPRPEHDCPSCRHNPPDGRSILFASPLLALMSPADQDAFWRAPGNCALWQAAP